MERKVFIGLGVIAIIAILYTHKSTIRVSRYELEGLSDRQSALLDKSGNILNKNERMQGAIAALRSALQNLQGQVNNLSRAVQTLEKDMKTMEGSLQQSNDDFQTLGQDMKAMEGGLQQSNRIISRIETTPTWNLYSLDMALALILFLCIIWSTYRWRLEHRRLKAAPAGQKTELKVLDGRKEQSDSSSAGMDQRKKA